MSTVTRADVTFAERAAGRAADAAQDAVALIAQGRFGEAVEVLREVRRHMDAAQTRLENGGDADDVARGEP